MKVAILAATLVVGASVTQADDWVLCWEGEMPLTTSMRDDYESRFASCAVRPERKRETEAVITRILKFRDRYAQVAEATGVPWFLVGVIHNMECGGRFDCHLHNGDPLTARTVQVPAGQPRTGAPPFTWEESAVDALMYQGFDVWQDWSVGGMLYKLEAYNGFGYRRRDVASPYLWGGSQHYVCGKYVKDGAYSATAVSQQIGVAVLIRRMFDQGLIEIPATAAAKKVRVLATLLNVRKGPSVSTASVASARQSELLTLLGERTTSGWLPVRLSNGTTGWVAEEFTTAVDAGASR